MTRAGGGDRGTVEQRHRGACGREIMRGGQADQATTDDHDTHARIVTAGARARGAVSQSRPELSIPRAV